MTNQSSVSSTVWSLGSRSMFALTCWLQVTRIFCWYFFPSFLTVTFSNTRKLHFVKLFIFKRTCIDKSFLLKLFLLLNFGVGSFLDCSAFSCQDFSCICNPEVIANLRIHMFCQVWHLPFQQESLQSKLECYAKQQLQFSQETIPFFVNIFLMSTLKTSIFSFWPDFK